LIKITRDRRLHATRRLVIVAAAVVAVGTGTAVADGSGLVQTSAPAAAGATVIRGCYVPSFAYVRILTATQSCRQGETAIQWNQTGPAGPAGIPGATGTTGATGPAGAPGATGAVGPAGTPGATGATGTAGAPGTTGGIGPAGPTGGVGPTGATGPAGPAGAATASLIGIPCDVGNATAGAIQSAIDPLTRVVTLTCVPTTTYTLTVGVTGNGVGNMTSAPAGIACGPTAGTACSKDYNPGAVVVVTAVPAAKSRFAGWTGACTGAGTCTVTMNAARTVSAQFVATVVVRVELSEPLGICYDAGGAGYACPYADPTGAHIVFDGGSQPDCIDGNIPYGQYAGYNTCDYIVDRGRPSINIDASVTGGSGVAVFGQWTGCAVVITTRCGVGADADITVSATFSS
jgi:hypothetical protein